MFFVASLFRIGNAANAEEPGCLRAIQARAIDEESSLKLPSHCRELHLAYTRGLTSLAENPEKFAQSLKKKIEAQKGVATPYNAILIAVLSQNPDLNAIVLPAIEKRAAIETKLKLNLSYATVAADRIKNGHCSNAKSPHYEEICIMSDPVYARVIALNESKALNDKLLKENRPSTQKSREVDE